MEIGEYLAALRKRWFVIAILGLLGAGLGYYQAQSTTPLYRSTAKVFVSLARGDTVADLVQGSTYTRNLVESYVQLATVPAVLEPVVEELDLTIDARQLSGIVHAEAPLDTMIIEISASSRSPQRASDIANAVAAQLSTTVESLSPTSEDGIASVKMTTVGPATPAAAPYSPNKKLLVATGGFLGLALGFVVALLWARLDTKVRSTGDVPREPARVVLGSIPYDRAVSKEGPTTIIEHPRGALAEAYRRVRANIDFLDSTDPVRSFVVTSTMPGEGKSTTSVSLALALADTGRRVLLVDADLRRPAIARICGLEGDVGLTTVLARKATLDDVRQPWGLEGLDIVTAGLVPPNPTQLIDSAGLAAFLEEAQATYDMVIVDTSPLLAVSDGAVLARLTGGALVIARARKVDRRDLVESLATIDAMGAVCLGVVLNGGKPVRRATSYGYMEPKRRSRSFRRATRKAAAHEKSLGPSVRVDRDVEPGGDGATTRPAKVHAAAATATAGAAEAGAGAAVDPTTADAAAAETPAAEIDALATDATGTDAAEAAAVDAAVPAEDAEAAAGAAPAPETSDEAGSPEPVAAAPDGVAPSGTVKASARRGDGAFAPAADEVPATPQPDGLAGRHATHDADVDEDVSTRI